jgi:hypothetical protein
MNRHLGNPLFRTATAVRGRRPSSNVHNLIARIRAATVASDLALYWFPPLLERWGAEALFLRPRDPQSSSNPHGAQFAEFNQRVKRRATNDSEHLGCGASFLARARPAPILSLT